jgi:hypothetical protein
MQRKLEEEREIQKTALGIYRDYKLGNKVYRISLFDSFPQRADLFSDLDILIVEKRQRLC